MKNELEILEAKAEKEWSVIAKEPVKVEIFGGTTIYAFGSELATLRLFKAFRYSKDVNQGFSENLKTCFFSIPKLF